MSATIPSVDALLTIGHDGQPSQEFVAATKDGLVVYDAADIDPWPRSWFSGPTLGVREDP